MNIRIIKMISATSLIIVIAMFTGACGDAVPLDRKSGSKGEGSSDYSAPQVAGKIENSGIHESSGLAASACQSDVLWTHNDAGDDALIYAINTSGRHLGTWKVERAENIDWEDIAIFKDRAGKCFLIIGDIGNNEEDRSELTIYKVPEPPVASVDSESNRNIPVPTAPAESMKFSYSDGTNNAETMMVRPVSGDIYILTKRESGPSRVHKLSPAYGTAKTVTQKIGEISVPAVPIGFLTGGSISPDGRRIALCDYQQGYELRLPADAADFDSIWGQTPVVIDLGKRKQGEGVTYSADGNTIYASSEGKNSPLIRVERRN
jgi:hypothetical protein